MLLSLTESASDVDVVTPLKLWKNYILFRSTLLLTNNALIIPLYVCLMWTKSFENAIQLATNNGH